MNSFTLDRLGPTMLIVSAVLVTAVVAVRLTRRSGLPSLLFYLAIGLALGDAGFGIRFDNVALAQALGYSALVLILADGGLNTQWREIRRSVVPALSLSTLGVMVSVVVVAASGHYLFDWSWGTSLLIGAILSSTDAAAVFSVLRNVPLPHRLKGMLEAESGFNDAPVVILVTALSEQLVAGKAESPAVIALAATLELLGGAAIGLAVGWLGAQLMRRIGIAASGLFSIGIIALCVLSFSLAMQLHSSGFIATYVCALVLGDAGLPHRAAVHGFSEAIGWLAQIGLFVMLGLLASPDGFIAELPRALIIGAVVLLLARPLSIAVSLAPFGFSWRDQAFLSWAGLRGAVPIVLATVPVTLHVPGLEWLLDLVFVLVVVNTALQAPLLPRLAHRLSVVEQQGSLDLGVDATPIEQLGADLLAVTIGPQSRLHGVYLFELRLPPGANVTLVIRESHSFVPTENTHLHHGDQLLIVTTARARPRAEQRIRDVSQEGRLVGWTTPPAATTH